MNKKTIISAIAAVAVVVSCLAEEASDAAGRSAYQPQVSARVGGFWGEQYKRLICKWIPHCIRQMEAGGEGEEFMNLFHAGESLAAKGSTASHKGKFKGCKWSDAYPYNIVEAACLALELDAGDDAELKAAQDFLKQKIEEWIPVILSAQEESGYIDSYTLLNGLEHFKKIGDHEFYVMGYFIEMGIAHHRATGDRRLVDAAIRCADHLDSIFGPPPKRTWMNGHPGLEYALCRLSDATGDMKYARLAQFFIRHQHTQENRRDYNQAERPAEDMREARGHAVRAVYFYAGMAGVANRLGDTKLGEAATDHGYRAIPQNPWCGMSKWELPMPDQTVTAIPEVAACRGKVAHQRGPIVYSWETHWETPDAAPKKIPNYGRLNDGGYSQVWISPENAAPKPLLPGFHPDPSVCLGHDGAYYLVTSSFMWRPGLPIYRSENFRDWSFVGHAVADFAGISLEEDTNLTDDDGVSAPTLRYYDGTYYMVFTFHGKKSRNYLTTAKCPEGPWTAPVHVQEADGVIDPSLFFDDGGKCYWMANTAAKPQEWKSQTAIYVQEIDLASGKLVGERKVISNGTMPQAKYAEGPHLLPSLVARWRPNLPGRTANGRAHCHA